MADITKEYLALRDQYIESRFARLNPVQRQAVFATEGPLLILAGAGSGKTTVLVNRIANIIRFGSAHGSTELPRPVTEADLNDLRNAVAAGRDLPRETAYLAVRPARPWNVLAITFTNKAAGELKERLRAMLGDTLGGDVNASTFHSACVRMLRRDAERIGFPKSFTIYDSDDQQRVIKQIYKDLMIDDKFLPVKSAIGQISSFKDKLLSAEDVAGEPFANTKAQLVSKIYTAYAGRCKMTRTRGHTTRTASAMSSWTSTRTRALRSSIWCGCWRAAPTTSASLATMTSLSTNFAVLRLRISSTLRRFSPGQKRSVWNKTIASMPLRAWFFRQPQPPAERSRPLPTGRGERAVRREGS